MVSFIIAVIILALVWSAIKEFISAWMIGAAIGLLIVVIILIRARRKARRQAQYIAQQTPPAPPAQTTPPAPAPAPVSDEPIAPPKEQNGLSLAYEYHGVEFYVPDVLIIAASHVPPNKQLTLAYEPDNEHDPDAISVNYKGQKIGYLYKNKRRDMVRDFAERDDRDFLVVSKKWTEKPVFDLYFYKNTEDVLASLRKKPGAIEFSIRSTAAQQDAIADCAPGTEVTVEYDPEKEAYLAYNGFYSHIGTVPEKRGEEITTGDWNIRVSEITENDSDRLTVRLIAIPGEASE